MSGPTDAAVAALLHDWQVVAEHDGGYVLGRCRVCARVDLLDVEPVPLPAL